MNLRNRNRPHCGRLIMKTKQVTVFTFSLFTLVWSIHGQPVITKQPADLSVSLGANVTNQVTATGAVPLTYLWAFNEMALASATNRSLGLTNIQLSHAGSYSVVVSDS